MRLSLLPIVFSSLSFACLAGSGDLDDNFDARPRSAAGSVPCPGQAADNAFWTNMGCTSARFLSESHAKAHCLKQIQDALLARAEGPMGLGCSDCSEPGHVGDGCVGHILSTDPTDQCQVTPGLLGTVVVACPSSTFVSWNYVCECVPGSSGNGSTSATSSDTETPTSGTDSGTDSGSSGSGTDSGSSGSGTDSGSDSGSSDSGTDSGSGSGSSDGGDTVTPGVGGPIDPGGVEPIEPGTSHQGGDGPLPNPVEP